MKLSQSLTIASVALFSLASSAPTPVDKVPDAPAGTNSDCGGGAQMGCHCIIEAVERFDPSLGNKGLPYYNKVPKCVFIPTIEQLLGLDLADGSPSIHRA
ncbi:hypothetical protein TWF970_009468 [Orbilia oligospora]|uniref:Hydrophobin n=1 Tax=Orbilia oligospora TaxID=2813651 RepID=A0A7C8RDN4_ORBOL|nr:hypothetical protein TWF970_009468 [Orbilia oligospora]